MVKRARKRTPPLPFSRQLVLNQWLFSLFGFDSMDGRYDIRGREVPLLEALRDRHQMMGEVVGRNSEGEHEIVQRLLNEAQGLPGISDEELREYDRNIKHLSESINDGRALAREEPVEWKYFQYLMLLFTEVYLDWLFRKPEDLRDALNKQVEAWNDQHADQPPLAVLDEAELPWLQLNKVAYWSATGSGKTLIMHANILQYRHYLEHYGNAKDLGRIILLTPNEGLTRQHLVEMETSGIHATPFSKNQGSLFADAVIVIDINKFRDEAKEKTVATASFGNNNLVLVDEGHRGSSGEEWLRHRNALCEKGFSFEYSATFAQAAMARDDRRQLYSKAILFDYSYRFFYGDGYGKQSQILNLQKNLDDKDHYAYLVASLLSFYQQRRLFDERKDTLKPFNIEPPLWIFVSSKVTASLSTGEASDTVQVLQFLDKAVKDKEATVSAIRRLLDNGMVGAGGVDLLSGRFDYLKSLTETPETLYSDLLERLFHTAGGHLYVENISGVAGEIALRAGASDIPFGVINVGDDSKLVKLCEKAGLAVQDSRFSASLFNDINQPDSRVNVLIGSKKFTEGWSSWRVSNMTLMNVGKSEGAQIIQLFGRGVRLKGWNETLKRSAEVVPQLPEGLERPKHIGVLETLNIFGVKADYIAQFRKELEEEEIPINEGLEEYRLPLAHIKPLPGNLSVIRLKESIAGRALGGQGSAFSQLAEQVYLLPPKTLKPQEKDYFICPPRITLDWYPQVKGFATDRRGQQEAGRNNGNLGALHLAMLDMDKLYFDLLTFKRDKRWASLTLSRDQIREVIADPSWYTLYIPKETLSPGALDGLRTWYDIALTLLKKYTEAFYAWRRKQWEADKLEYRPLVGDKALFPGVSEETPGGSYVLTVDRNRHESLINQLDKLRTEILGGNISNWRGQKPSGLELLWCERHLYQPLLAQHDKEVEVAPVPLNKGEQQFVEDMQKAMENGVFKGFETYLLRNESRGDGVGFFLEGGFYPDFILWLIQGAKQKIVFIDPKGLRNHKPEDPKVQFYKSIKTIEADLHAQDTASKDIELHAFLVSNTLASMLESQWSGDGRTVTKQDMEGWNILFQIDDADDYVSNMVKRVL
ncbi:MAG: DEAD/DEAH box helicase [Gammaproteobacteria bacterium (ex Lamellibrachia satsuma)]|nr:MAG: DEAD/DEAH box helicase [Gammaproteobacteria bacterium (ex Lamellibrachia satsuma)]RRS36130.1 MAG: DEAD/DEAH box helicase [Gammaproteobacteria bacterium (ex Lamellibrachia satsuma)]